jgi:histidinol-phosphate aminotransferase
MDTNQLEQQFFNNGYKSIPIVEKQNYSGFINLSSNQLEHSEYHLLFKDFISKIDCDLVRQYSYLKPIVEKIAGYNNIDSKNIILSAGSDIAIYFLIDLIGGNSRKILIQSPTYRSYYEYAKLKNIEINEVIYLGKIYHQFLDDLFEQCAAYESSALIVLTNPNNFTGEYLPLDELTKILDVCNKKNHIVIIDESYIDFSNFTHYEVYKAYNNIILIKTLSKSYGLAGLRLAITYSQNTRIIEYLKRSGLEKTTSIISAHFYKYLLENKSLLDNLIKQLQDAKNNFIQTLCMSCPKYFIYPSSTNFTTIDVRATNIAEQLTQYIRQHGLLIKHLYMNEMATSLVRVTTSEKNVMEKLGKLIIEHEVNVANG